MAVAREPFQAALSRQGRNSARGSPSTLWQPGSRAQLTMAADTGASDAFVVEFALLMCLCLAIYILPTVIAFSRRHPNRFPIMAINIVLGGTGLGWFGALIWALSIVHLPRQQGKLSGGESELNLAINDVRVVQLVPAARRVDDPSLKPQASLSPAAAVAELERLGRLRADGHLSEREFALLKQAVFARIRTT